MAVNLFALSTRALTRNVRFTFQNRAMSTDIKHVIGAREVVGFGFNGQPCYGDRVDYPMPAIRWKEPSSDINVSLLQYVLDI